MKATSRGEDLNIFVDNNGKGRWQSFTAPVDLKYLIYLTQK